MVDTIVVAIRNSGLDRLRRLADLALDLLTGSLLRSRSRLLAQFLVALGDGLVFGFAFVGVGAVLAVLLHELGEVLNGARPGVKDRLRFAASGEELDGWEALDLIGHIVGGSIHFGNDNL